MTTPPAIVSPSALPHGPTVIWRAAVPLRLHFDQCKLYGSLEKARFGGKDSLIRIEAGGTARFDRLLNVFAHRKWVELTGVTELAARVTYRGGPGRLSVLTFDGQTVRRAVGRVLDRAEERTSFAVSLPARLQFSDLLFWQIEAEDAIEVQDLAIVTSAKPVNSVRVGIVITTFNRQAEVEEQAEELQSLVDCDTPWHLFIVDNGRNLDLPPPIRNTTVIASPNLGGSGGFTRGLLEVMESGDFTHAMFMDDDALCHPTAIARAMSLMRYSRHPDLALTGAMHYSHDPETQYELGGSLAAYGVQSIRMDVKANDLASLYRNEKAQTPDYGAWWCFLFPLSSVRALPFPFFIRGDDVTFSLQNAFRLNTLPGLVAWQPSFDRKIGATVEYLVHRSFLAMPLLAQTPGWRRATVLTGLRRSFRVEIEGLRYPLAEGICQALEDVLTGPNFWASTANTLARLQGLGALERAFSERSADATAGYWPPGRQLRPFLRLLQRFIGGVNLPACLCPRQVAWTDRLSPQPGQAFLRPGVIYRAEDGSRSLDCRRDWRWRRRLERRFAKLAAEYEQQFDRLVEEYGQGSLQSLEAWKERFGIDVAERAIAHPSL